MRLNSFFCCFDWGAAGVEGQNDPLNTRLFKIEKAKKKKTQKTLGCPGRKCAGQKSPKIRVMSSRSRFALSIARLFPNANLPHGEKSSFNTWGTVLYDSFSGPHLKRILLFWVLNLET